MKQQYPLGRKWFLPLVKYQSQCQNQRRLFKPSSLPNTIDHQPTFMPDD